MKERKNKLTKQKDFKSSFLWLTGCPQNNKEEENVYRERKKARQSERERQ